ncbi:MAG: anthranilate synthase component I family protein [Phycisphaerales bacterium JB047]
MSSQPSQPDTQALAQPHAHAVFHASGLGGSAGARVVEGCWCIDQATPDPLETIERIMHQHASPRCTWALMLSYELGGSCEPHAQSAIADPIGFPLCVVMRLGDASQCERNHPDTYTIGPAKSLSGRSRYIRQVERVRSYIGEGDIYQANIAHHLVCPFQGDPLACAHDLQHGAQPRYGATMRFEHRGTSHTICSVSPELFVRLDRLSGRIKTEPMKGTRAIDGDADELEQSPKDRAELNMITDLMRNDLGRVCTLGSVRVQQARKIEPHASGVIQASSVIEGTLGSDVGIAALIRAIFPPGSVTGAPKVRAMQIIDELEQRSRRSYCGSMMHIDEHGNIEACVSIRTAHIWGEASADNPDQIVNGQFIYPVGAGIVADSDPESEWEETLVKAGVLRSVLGLDLGDLG